MLYCSRGDFERAIYDLENHFGADYDGMTNGECVEQLRKLCPQLHSDDDLKQLAETLVDTLFDEFGWNGMRVWFELNNSSPFFKNSMMSMKYDKLYDDISAKAEEFRVANDLTLKLDVYLFGMKVKDTYRERYGSIDEDAYGLMDLYSVLNTIRLSHYNSVVIRELQNGLKFLLVMVGDKYYSQMDLSKPEVLQEVYTHIAEIVGDDNVYQGHSMFYDYDGYGGSYCTVGGDRE